MSLLDLVPYVVFHIMVFIGICGFIAAWALGKIPLISKYELPITVISICLIIVGTYFEGAISTQKEWELKITEAEKKVLEMQVLSAQANTELAEQIAKNDELRKEKRNATSKIITKVVTKYDDQCKLSNAFVQLHDSASRNAIPPGAEQIAGGTTDIKASEVLEVVTSNYSTCYDLRDRVLGWQEWYKIQKEIFKK